MAHSAAVLQWCSDAGGARNVLSSAPRLLPGGVLLSRHEIRDTGDTETGVSSREIRDWAVAAPGTNTGTNTGTSTDTVARHNFTIFLI